MAIRIPFAGKYVYFGPETGLHTQGEARAETYDLTGPRYYDGHDLSALTWYVRATHPDYHTIINKQLSVTIAPDDEEAVVISWPVDADFMACSGELQVQFVAKSAAGTEIIKLQSNGLQISPSVEGTAAPPKNMFEAALAQMQDLADTAANAAAQSKQDAERADDAVATTAENVAVAEKAVETAKESVKEAAGLVEQTEAKAAAAEASAKLAESWAVGGTGSREGEDTDNAKYYAQIAQQVAQGGVGYYETPEALRTAHPTGQAGNWAIVGSTDTIWVWDTDTGDWVDSHGNIDLSNYYTKTEADARFSAISSGVPTVPATKEQNYFDIDLPSTNQFVIVPNAAYATGDTFRIAGRAVAAMLPNGDSLPDAFFAANAKVMCLWADTVLYFVGGGTVPNNVMRYRMDDGTPGQQPEQTIWGQTSDGQDAYVHSCTKAVYNPETGKTLDEEMVTMQDSPAAITGETPIKPVCDASGNVICPQTRTAAVYDPVSGQTLDAVLGEEKLKLLWTNPAPLENFGKQTVALDLSKYDLVLISFMNGNSANYVNNGIFFIGDTVQTANGFSGSQKNHRNIIVSSNGVEFQESYKYATYGASVSATIDYSIMRPLYIYGIKL